MVTDSLTDEKIHVLAWPDKSTNPYTPLLYTNMGSGVVVDEFSAGNLFHNYAVWHVHWPESLLNIPNAIKAACKLAAFFVAVDYLRWRGTKLIWTMHNFKAHDALHPSMEKLVWRLLIPRIDGAISLSWSALLEAKTKFPRLRELPMAVIPHGHYRDEYPSGTAKARESLGIPAKARVILFFGAIREYKNVDALIRAFREVTTPEAMLYVVGRPNSSPLTDLIRKEASVDTRVRLVLGFVEREDVSAYMQAADLVVLPYRAILNSGSALLALSFNRPVLVPDLGSMGELRDDFGSDWVHTFSGKFDGGTLERSLEWSSQPRPRECPMPDKYNWESIRAQTVRFYRQVVSTNK